MHEKVSGRERKTKALIKLARQNTPVISSIIKVLYLDFI